MQTTIYQWNNVQGILHLICIQLQQSICQRCNVQDIHCGLLDPSIFLLNMPCIQNYQCLNSTILEDMERQHLLQYPQHNVPLVPLYIHCGLLDPNNVLLSMPDMQYYQCLKTTILEDI